MELDSQLYPIYWKKQKIIGEFHGLGVLSITQKKRIFFIIENF